LDEPLYKQYYNFLKGAVKGELGNSFIHNTPALKLILQRFPATMELATFAILISVVFGIPLGMIAGLKPNALFSRATMAGSVLGFSLPSFWVGLMMIIVFSLELGFLPTMGRGNTVEVVGIDVSFLTWDGIKHLLLPGINLALYPFSLIIRLTRSSVQEVVLIDFVKFAQSKGLKTGRLLLVHILRNILIPIVTVVGVQFGVILAFAVVTESVFAWPGMGKLIIDSINLLDRPVIVAYLMLTALFFLIINLAVDIIYSLVDPRVRL
jgi:peptide/nickel transport system permease protein